MRILLLGASGFIGSALSSRLVSQQHQVVSVSRSDAAVEVWRHFKINIAQATSAEHWLVALDGVEAAPAFFRTGLVTLFKAYTLTE